MLVTYSETVTTEIKAEMARQDLSQTKLAGRLGWKQQYLSRRLTRPRMMTIDEAEEIATALGKSLADLGIPARRAGVR